MITTSFKDERWHKRLRHLGDEAEGVYRLDRDSAGIRYDRSGLNRPPFNVAKLPLAERFRPDYIEVVDGRPRYVEVQGIGQDQTIKVKDNKWQSMLLWHEIWGTDDDGLSVMPVILFIWNRTIRLVTEVQMDELARHVLRAQQDNRTNTFDSGRNLYYEIPWEMLSVEPQRPPRTDRSATGAPRRHVAVGRGGVSGSPVRASRARRTDDAPDEAEGSSRDGAVSGNRDSGNGEASGG